MSVPDFGPYPEPEEYPGIVKCRGGWFAVQRPGELGSGPWKNVEAAKLALAGEFKEAWKVQKQP
jgi:hypothetical protein